MSILKRFKSYSVRVPKVIREHVASQLGLPSEKELSDEQIPSASYFAIDLENSETAIEISKLLDETAGQVAERITTLITAVKEAGEAEGRDMGFLSLIPDMGLVAEHLVKEMNFTESIKVAFRKAAFDEFLGKNPDFAEVMSGKKASKGRGLQVEARI